MVVAGEVVVTFTFETSFIEVGDVRFALIPFVVGLTYDLCLWLLTNEVIVIGGDTVSVVDNGGHATSLRVVDIVDVDFVLNKRHNVQHIAAVVFVVVDPVVLVE